jgi:hypothetical protein
MRCGECCVLWLRAGSLLTCVLNKKAPGDEPLACVGGCRAPMAGCHHGDGCGQTRLCLTCHRCVAALSSDDAHVNNSAKLHSEAEASQLSCSAPSERTNAVSASAPSSSANMDSSEDLEEVRGTVSCWIATWSSASARCRSNVPNASRAAPALLLVLHVPWPTRQGPGGGGRG